MSTPKFTPWRVDYARCAGYIVRSQDGLSLIVDYMDDNCEHGAIESEEHARLIAAAPELYEAAIGAAASLAAAISLLEGGGKKAAPSDRMFDQMLVDYRNALETARAVLAKARGEAP